MIEIVPATMVHAAHIRLRPGDEREIAMHGLDKMEALQISLARSLHSEAYLIDGEVAAITGCGLTCMLGGYATPWVVTGLPVNDHRKEFLRHSKARVELLRARHGVLVNWVYADYAEAMRWMKWLGFTITHVRPLGPYGAPFARMSIGEH